MMVMYRHVCNERDDFLKKTLFEIYEKIFKNIQKYTSFHTYTHNLSPYDDVHKRHILFKRGF